MEARCKVAQHSTGWMAGAFAECIRSKQLVLTHFSARYYEPTSSRPDSSTRYQGGGGGSHQKSAVRGDWRTRPVDLDAEAEAAARSVGALVQEARKHFGGRVRAAHDFYTVNVPSRFADSFEHNNIEFEKDG